MGSVARDSANLAGQILSRLALRHTRERLEIVRVFLESPGLSPGALARELQTGGMLIHLRTVTRMVAALQGPTGCLARWEVAGPAWVCWGCGRGIQAMRTEPAVTGLLAVGVLPLDLGGYCQACQEVLSSYPIDPAAVPPGLRKVRSASAQVNRRALLVPVSPLYQNPALMRELLGSNRRVIQRDYTVAHLVENPRAGPTTLHRLLQDELAPAPALRSVKRVSSILRSPKAQMLFSSLGAVAWACLGCSAWGAVPNPTLVRDTAPPGFVSTDVRTLCSTCRETKRVNCHNREK